MVACSVVAVAVVVEESAVDAVAVAKSKQFRNKNCWKAHKRKTLVSGDTSLSRRYPVERRVGDNVERKVAPVVERKVDSNSSCCCNRNSCNEERKEDDVAVEFDAVVDVDDDADLCESSLVSLLLFAF